MFKKILWSLAILVVLFVSVAFVLPQNIVVERQISIDAPAADIYPHIADLSATQAWSPWYDDDPDVQLSFEGEPMTVGSKMSWSSEVESVGSGTQEILALSPNESVRTALDFGPQGQAEAEFRLTANADKTDVVWAFHMDAGNNPVTRYFGLMMDGWLGPYYEKGLDRLKKVIETAS